MKKTIWIARVADDNSDAYKAYFDKKAAEDSAYGYHWHLTDKEKETHIVTVEGYEVDVPDDDSRDAKTLFEDMLIDDVIGDPDFYQEVKEAKKVEVTFSGGQSRNGDHAVNYMLANVGDVELYAEDPIPEDLGEDTSSFDDGSYERLKAEIIAQAKTSGIDPDTLSFWWD